MNDHPDIPDTHGDAPANTAFDVGVRLRQVRQARGLSQRELARRANMTNGSLSMIEQGKVSPSINSLERILGALPMSLAEFFLASDNAPEPVLWRHQAIHISKQAYSLAIHDLHPFTATKAFLAEMVLQNGESSGCDWLMCSAFIWGAVVAGSVELRLSEHSYHLEDGDAFYFNTASRHVLVNTGQVPARLIFTVSSSGI